MDQEIARSNEYWISVIMKRDAVIDNNAYLGRWF